MRVGESSETGGGWCAFEDADITAGVAPSLDNVDIILEIDILDFANQGIITNKERKVF
ncbi:MAG: hypothetical protein AABZ42_06015 [Thermoproteota archaeon]